MATAYSGYHGYHQGANLAVPPKVMWIKLVIKTSLSIFKLGEVGYVGHSPKATTLRIAINVLRKMSYSKAYDLCRWAPGGLLK